MRRLIAFWDNDREESKRSTSAEMGFLGESASPASCLGVPIGAGTRSPPEFSTSRWPNPKREFLSFESGTRP